MSPIKANIIFIYKPAGCRNIDICKSNKKGKEITVHSGSRNESKVNEKKSFFHVKLGQDD